MSDEPAVRPRIFTWRAILTGIIAAAAMAAVVPINDFHFKNSLLYGMHLPASIICAAVVLGAMINPLLGRRRFSGGESAVIIGLLLVIGGVVSTGLIRELPAIMAGPARVLPSDMRLTPLRDGHGTPPFPQQLFLGLPERGMPDPNDPGYRLVIEGFHSGLPNDAVARHGSRVTWQDATGATHHGRIHAGSATAALSRSDPILDGIAADAFLGRIAGEDLVLSDGPGRLIAVEPAGVPWRAWLGPALGWFPLLLAILACCLGLIGVVRHQWMHNERLPYPIARAIGTYLDPPAPGQRFAAIYRDLWFRIGFVVVAIILTSQVLLALGWFPVGVPTNIDLSGPFGSLFQKNTYSGSLLANWRVFFCIAAIAFLVPPDLSFSVWACYLLTNLVYALAWSQGIPLERAAASQAGIGGFIALALLIVWIGRRYYGRVLLAAFRRRDEDPVLRSAVFHARLLLAGAVGLVVVLVVLGARTHHAILVVLLTLGFVLVIARLVAEAGIPLVNIPVFPNDVILAITGTSPAAVLIPLGLIWMITDGREHVGPYAATADRLVDSHGGAQRGWTLLMGGTLILATVVAGIVLIYLCYHHEGMATKDAYWRTTLLAHLRPLAETAGGTPPLENSATPYVFGGALTAGLVAARLHWAAWPLHPLGYLASMTYAANVIWFSFFVGWLAKTLITRYGGQSLYKRMIPLALGCMAAEACCAAATLVITLILRSCGIDVPQLPNFLPV